MGYRVHYSAASHLAGAILRASEANAMIDPEVPTDDDLYVLLLSDEGNQERFVVEGTGQEIKTLLDSLTRQLASRWPDPRLYG